MPLSAFSIAIYRSSCRFKLFFLKSILFHVKFKVMQKEANKRFGGKRGKIGRGGRGGSLVRDG